MSVFDYITYFIVPIASVIAFLIIVLFPIIGTVNTIRDNQATIKQKDAEIASLDATITDLETLARQDPVVQTNLAKIDKIVPSEKSEVVQFVLAVEDIAKQNNLEKTEQKSDEGKESVDEDTQTTDYQEVTNQSASIISINNQFSFKGDKLEIENFLNALYHRDDFIIVSTMKMEGPEARELQAQNAQENGTVYVNDPDLEDKWTIDVKFSKHIFSENFTNMVSQTEVGINELPDEETLKLINSRY